MYSKHALPFALTSIVRNICKTGPCRSMGHMSPVSVSCPGSVTRVWQCHTCLAMSHVSSSVTRAHLPPSGKIVEGRSLSNQRHHKGSKDCNREDANRSAWPVLMCSVPFQ